MLGSNKQLLTSDVFGRVLLNLYIKCFLVIKIGVANSHIDVIESQLQVKFQLKISTNHETNQWSRTVATPLATEISQSNEN